MNTAAFNTAALDGIAFVVTAYVVVPTYLISSIVAYSGGVDPGFSRVANS